MSTNRRLEEAFEQLNRHLAQRFDVVGLDLLAQALYVLQDELVREQLKYLDRKEVA